MLNALVPGVLLCPACAYRTPPGPDPDPCSRCGEPVFYDPPHATPKAVPTERVSPWRFAALLPPVHPVSLGEGSTSLVASRVLGPRLGINLWFKLEGGNPTGSFKDRGAAVLVAVLQALGVRAVADDSSGNAGAALAAYAARAGMQARLFVPEHASPRKLSQIRAYGAELTVVTGPRHRCEEAVRDACGGSDGWVYASHNLSPYFVEGLTTLALELLEERPGEHDWHLVVPAGAGGLLLGLARGFARMGAPYVAPHLHIAQPASCAPLVRALDEERDGPVEIDPAPTLAEGASIPRPERGRQVLAAVRASQGSGTAITEPAIKGAQETLAREEGILAEPTSALATAALESLVVRKAIPPDADVVVVLTGTGLKAL